MEKNTKAINWKGGENGIKNFFDYAGFQFCINEILQENGKIQYYLALYDRSIELYASFKMTYLGRGRDFFKNWYRLKFKKDINPLALFGDFDEWSYRYSDFMEFRGKERAGKEFITTVNKGERLSPMFDSIDEVKDNAQKWLDLHFGSLLDKNMSAPALDSTEWEEVREDG